MSLSFLRARRERVKSKRPASVGLGVEPLDRRIVPTIGTGAHFVYATSSVADSGALVVNFKEAGLGNDVTVDYTLTGDVSATFGYTNKGGNVVQGEPWEATNVTLATGTFTSDKNGSIEATLTSAAPTPNLAQPNGNGWTLVYDISYTNLVLTDTTYGVTTAVPDATANTFPPPKH